MSTLGWAESHSKCFSMYSSKFWYIQVLSSISCAVLKIMITQHILKEQQNPAFPLVVPSWSVSSENKYAVVFSAISTPWWLQPGRLSRQHITTKVWGTHQKCRCAPGHFSLSERCWGNERMVMLPAKQTPFPENKMSVTPPTWKNDELVVPPWFCTADRQFSEGQWSSVCLWKRKIYLAHAYL